MPDTFETRVLHPTRVPSLDKVLGGGVISGSTILVLAEPGSGGNELVQTSLMNYCTDFMHNTEAPEGTIYPAELHYISLTLNREMFEHQIAELFNTEKNPQFRKMMENIHYTDLGENYFGRTHVPYDWYGSKDSIKGVLNMPASDDFGGLTILVEKITKLPRESIIFIDSLTALLPYLTRTPETWLELVTMMRGLTRAAKKWRITIVFLLVSGVLSPGQENELIDSVDAVLNLFWQKNTTVKRQRQMYLLKFTGLFPRIDPRDMVIFNVNIATGIGFEITNMRLVS
ncbi:hypothetical protein O0S10_05095 [Methanocorpusculum sp. MG]|uniref:Recombinase RecA n=1 Tax=Methanocorpusculum petauri TaxID=3002863 RepID=A0ABT4IH91_9EURY|nr:hypothetical protein [Methanocorpusculum petauri]MCZ0860607.1 hypothetical protein [Methanocorpusculum petauri]MDE2443324.1 hypothetical protein [Methanocorpusculum sp.]